MLDLDFDPDTHVYMAGGAVLPSVTQLLRPLYDFRFVDPEVLKAAGVFGTAVHRVCELFDLDDLVMDSVDDALMPYLDGWRLFLSETGAKVLQVEARYHHSLGFAGTLDRVLAIKQDNVLADIKSVSKLSPVVGIQLAAYQALLAENTDYRTVKRSAVQLCPDGTYRYRLYRDPMDWPAFVSLKTLQNWRTKHAA